LIIEVGVVSAKAIQGCFVQTDLSEYYNESMESESEEVIAKKPTEDNRTLHFIGLGVALLVLITSLVIHFIQEI
jgi:hypothetical protein